MKIGFIGPGRMGRPMVDRLMAAGHDVTVLVRRPEARAAAEADGLTCADTVPAAVKDADAAFVVVLLMRKDVAVVRQVAGDIGADLGILGSVLSSDAVERKVLTSPVPNP